MSEDREVVEMDVTIPEEPDKYMFIIGVNKYDRVFVETLKDGQYVDYTKLDHDDRQMFLQLMASGVSIISTVEKKMDNE